MPTPRRTALLAGLTAGLLALGTVGCTGAGKPSGPGDKRITVYSGRGESLVGPLLTEFTRSTGVTVDVRYAGTAAMAGQLIEEGDRSPADVFLAQDAGALGAVAKNGLFAPLPAEVTAKVPGTYRSRAGEWVGVSARARVLAYHPGLAPAATLPASVLDLTGPAWKGRVGVAPTNASFQAFVTALRVRHGDERARRFLTDLAANSPLIRENNVVLVEEVDAGRVPVALVNHYYLGEVARERGTTPQQLTVKLHFFPDGDTGALVNVAGVGVLDRAAEDPDTRAFVDYLLGPDAQRYFAERTHEYPVVAGAPAPAYVPPLAELTVPEIDLNDLDQLDTTVTMLKESGLLP